MVMDTYMQLRKWLKSMDEIARADMVNKAIEELLILKIQDVNFFNSFNELGINDVCIYGMGKLGKYLFRIVNDAGIKIVVCVDNSPSVEYGDVVIVSKDKIKDYVDQIGSFIVTSEYYYDEIKSELNENFDKQVVLLRDILEEMIMHEHCRI